MRGARALFRGVRDQRGTVAVEYALVLTLVALGMITALIAAGDLLVGLFRYQEALLIVPYP